MPVLGCILGALSPAYSQVTKEYVRVDGRVIAMESNAGQVMPSNNSVAPSSGAASGATTFPFSDLNGASTLNVLRVLMKSALDGANACYFAYVAPSNLIVLLANHGVDGLVLSLPSGGFVKNDQSRINGSGTAAVVPSNSPTLSLTVNITF